jgi:hypothetical protein
MTGNLEMARTLLDDVVYRAGTFGLGEILARGSHERGVVAHERSRVSGRDEDLFDALAHYHLALEKYSGDDGAQRCRLLCDIGRSLFRLGLRAEAQRACQYAYTAGTDRTGRWAAGNNLIMIAVAERDRETFDRYRAALERAPMPARLRVEYLTEVGDGCVVFGLPDEARIAFERAARIRDRFQLPERDENLGTSEKRDPPVDPPATVVDLSKAVLALK